MISTNLVNLLKRQELVGPVVALLELKYGEGDESNSFYVCNYKEEITSGGKTYKPAVFDIKLPKTEDNPKILLQFAAVQKEIDKQKLFEVLDKLQSITIEIKDFENQGSDIFDKVFFFYDQNDVFTVSSSLWSISLSKFRILGEEFPAKRFNIIDHPTIFAKLG